MRWRSLGSYAETLIIWGAEVSDQRKLAEEAALLDANSSLEASVPVQPVNTSTGKTQAPIHTTTPWYPQLFGQHTAIIMIESRRFCKLHIFNKYEDTPKLPEITGSKPSRGALTIETVQFKLLQVG